MELFQKNQAIPYGGFAIVWDSLVNLLKSIFGPIAGLFVKIHNVRPFLTNPNSSP